MFNIKKFYLRLKIIYLSIRYIGNPDLVSDLIAMSQTANSREHFEFVIEEFEKNEKTRQRLKARLLDPFPSLAELQKYPGNSFGKVYAEHMIKNGLDPEFYKSSPNTLIDPDVDYIKRYMYQTHDILHVLTGFDTSYEDEAALQAFIMAQMRFPFNAFIIGLMTLHFSFFKTHKLFILFERIMQGWNAGKKAQPVFGINWIEEMKKPLEEVREKYFVSL